MKILISILFLFMISCHGPPPENKFHYGDMVKSVIIGQTGQIVGVRCYPGNSDCFYDVRFGFNQENIPNHRLGSGGTIKQLPLGLITYMREFELTHL